MDADIEDHLQKFQTANIDLHKKLLSNISIAQEKQKREYGKRVKGTVEKFEIGSKVMVANVKLKNQKGRKLDQRYSGPMTVVHMHKKQCFLEDGRGIPLQNPVHKGRLKLFRGDEGSNH